MVAIVLGMKAVWHESFSKDIHHQTSNFLHFFLPFPLFQAKNMSEKTV
jgi:hypothetical protein